MNTVRGRSTIYLFASLLLVTVAWWGCGGGTSEQAGGESGQAEESTGGGESAGEMETPALDEISLATGAGVYKARCTMCHGETGKGDGPAGRALDPSPRDHTNAEYMNTLTDEQIKSQIMEGKGAMPPHKDLLSEVELESVVLHVRSLSE
jgi:cytochrome c oxidase cbb3-type subunit 3